MRRAIAADFAELAGVSARVVMTLDSRLPDDPGPWTIERIAPGDALHQVCELAGMADFTVLVAPETSGILARLTREFQAAGAEFWARPLMPSTSPATRIASPDGSKSMVFPLPGAGRSSPRRDCPPMWSTPPSSNL